MDFSKEIMEKQGYGNYVYVKVKKKEKKRKKQTKKQLS